MRLAPYLRSLGHRFLRRGRLETELDEELRAHVQLRADDLQRHGLAPDAAERQAWIEFGGVTRYKDEARDAIAGGGLETLLRDIRFSVRQLRKTPSFAVAAIVTLAVAIGANAVVFSAVNGFILRPLGLPNEDRLYTVERAQDASAGESYPNYLDLRARERSVYDLAAFYLDEAWVGTGGTPARAWIFEVTGNYFDVVGVRPALGRLIHASDDRGPDSAPFIVLSYPYWTTRFQSDSNVVGRVVEMNKHPFTVIGVTPRNFRGTVPFFSPDVFVPAVNQDQIDGGNALADRANRWLTLFGRLQPGVTPERALADLNAGGAVLQKLYPKQDEALRFLLTRSGAGQASFDQALDAFLVALTGLAVLILLAACANLGSLFAARATDRSREVALRLALGAGRVRIIRQILTEAVLIAIAGGAVGLWTAVLALHWVVAWRPFAQFPINLPIAPDARVYLVALLLSLTSALLFGAMPIRQMLRTSPYEVLKSGPRATFGRRVGVRELLLAVQVAICAVLLTSSLVAVRGLTRSLHAHLGINPANALLVESDLVPAGYRGVQVDQMRQRMRDATLSIPGVTAAGFVGPFPPMHIGWEDGDVFAEDATDLRPSKAVTHSLIYRVSPGYFDAARTSIVAGRGFTVHDDSASARVAVVNESFVRKALASTTQPIGRFFKLPDGARVQVVGVVEDGKYTANLAEDASAAMFFPLLQAPSSEAWMVVRTGSDVQRQFKPIETKLHELDPRLPLFVETWTQDLDGALFAPRMAVAALGAFGGMGAIVAITGIFGMAAHSLSKRLKELGIRTALGAQRFEVLNAALGRAFKVLAVGSAIGLMLGVLASGLLGHLVYQATPRDPFVLAGVVAGMLLLGLIATWIPARRALAVDPAALLREE